MANNEGIGQLRFECPQGHRVGRIGKDVAHQMVQFDPGAAVGPRRFWPEEHEQQRFETRCAICDRPLGESTATLKDKLAALLADQVETSATATLAYL